MKTEPNNSSLHKKSFKILLQYSVLIKQNKKQKQNLTNKQITPTKPHKETMLFAKPIIFFLSSMTITKLAALNNTFQANTIFICCLAKSVVGKQKGQYYLWLG